MNKRNRNSAGLLKVRAYSRPETRDFCLTNLLHKATGCVFNST